MHPGGYMNFTDLRVLKTQECLQNALLELLETKELKAITVKEICERAGISRNAFYQHYGYKEDLYDQMVSKATERIRDALMPVVPDDSYMSEEIILTYARSVVAGILEVKELIYVMLKGDDGVFLRQFTDLIYGQILTNALSFFDMKDSAELRLYYEFQSAGIAAFIIRWIREDNLPQQKAEELLAQILLLPPAQKPVIGAQQKRIIRETGTKSLSEGIEGKA